MQWQYDFWEQFVAAFPTVGPFGQGCSIVCHSVYSDSLSTKNLPGNRSMQGRVGQAGQAYCGDLPHPENVHSAPLQSADVNTMREGASLDT